MHLSIMITLFATLASICIVMLWYFTSRWCSYLRGHFQYSVLFPKHYIFPKRISSKIRPHIIHRFKITKHRDFYQLEDQIVDYLDKMDMNTVAITMTEQECYQYKTSPSEDSFRYFLFLYTMGIITGLVKSDFVSESDMSVIRDRIRHLNLVVMQRYLKKFINNRDRPIILAEILWRLVEEASATKARLPYGQLFYKYARIDSIIETHDALISAALNDPDVISIIKSMRLEDNPVYLDATMSDDLMFAIYVCLSTEWYKE